MNYETTMIPITDDAAETDSPGRRRRIWVITVLAVIAAALLAWYLTRGEEQAEPFGGDDADQVPVVSVVTPGRGTIAGTIETTGTLAARRALPVGSVGEGGRVERVTVDEGAWVRQGQVLVVIDQGVQAQQIAAARANVRVADADADLAQANLDRALRLVDRGFISDADVDRLTATRDAARARVNVAQAQAGELRARTARLNVTAPASGLILQRNVEPGQVVSGAAGALFTIAQNGAMELQAQVSEDELAGLSVGQSATVTPVGADRSYQGQIWQVSPTIDATSRQGNAAIALDYAPGLRPGGFASATIRRGTLVAPRLPESAILSDNQGSYVFVVGPDNTVRRRAVRTGIVGADGIAIADGLDGTERVVLRAGGFLNEGDRIKPERVQAAR